MERNSEFKNVNGIYLAPAPAYQPFFHFGSCQILCVMECRGKGTVLRHATNLPCRYRFEDQGLRLARETVKRGRCEIFI